jgi:hypothetical protein
VLRWIGENGKREISVQDIRRDALRQSVKEEKALKIIEGLVRGHWARELPKKPHGADDLGVAGRSTRCCSIMQEMQKLRKPSRVNQDGPIEAT